MTLNNYLKDSLSRPYEVGEWDCALFVAEWVDILTGSDRADYFRGLYQEKEEGLAQFGPLRRRVAMELDSLGFFKAETARLGDVALLRGGLIGIVIEIGEALAVATVLENTSQGGLITLPMDYARGVYRWEA
jgi:hypothetical protein